ncbi:hypothetical protein [Micrococcus luteus]|uniref:hypothetical protein n=1 Tax=Micrococcus luteus TaxID=1270 RepID=UPI002302B275|nr:hypothetical protein [Micrococcus luteus]
MALKKLPGGVIVETAAGSRLNEEAGVNLEAIHRQIGVQATAMASAEADRAEAAADRVGAPLITAEDVGFEGAVGDADGRPSWLRYDTQGLPTPYVADALETVGVPHAEDSGDGLTIAGEDGTPTWLSATGEGGPDGHALTWLANALHVYVGPDEPEVHPGGWIVWTRTDAHGTPIETLIGRN